MRKRIYWITVATGIGIFGLNSGGLFSFAPIQQKPKVQLFFLASRNVTLKASVLYQLAECYTQQPQWARLFPLTLRYVQACAEYVYDREISAGRLPTQPNAGILLNLFVHHPPVSVYGWKIYHDLLRKTGRQREETLSADIRAQVRGFWGKVVGLSVGQKREFLRRFGIYITPADHLRHFQTLMEQRNATEALNFLTEFGHQCGVPGYLRLALDLGRPGAISSASLETRYKALLPAQRHHPILQVAYVQHLLRPVSAGLEERAGRLHTASTLIVTLLKEKSPMLLKSPIVGSLPLRLAKAYQHIAISYSARGNKSKSLQHGQNAVNALEVMRLYPKLCVPIGKEGLWLAGIITLRPLRNPAKALQYFQAIPEGGASEGEVAHGSMRHKARALYYQGICWERLHQKSKALSLFQQAAAYPTVFYGQLAHQKLGKPVTIALTSLGQGSPSSSHISPEAQEFLSLLKVWKTLDPKARNNAPLMVFLKEGMHHLRTREEKRAFLVLIQDWPPHTFPHLAQKLQSQGSSRFLICAEAYPRLSVVSMPKDSKEASLIHGLILQESGFHPEAPDPWGGRGLMQIIPLAAKEAAARLKIPYVEKRLLESEYNVRLGVNILHRHVKLMHGSYILALASYNAGRTQVLRWIQRHPPTQTEEGALDWLEMFFLTDTRSYVQQVLENYVVYRALHQNPVQAKEWPNLLRVPKVL